MATKVGVKTHAPEIVVGRAGPPPPSLPAIIARRAPERVKELEAHRAAIKAKRAAKAARLQPTLVPASAPAPAARAAPPPPAPAARAAPPPPPVKPTTKSGIKRR